MAGRSSFTRSLSSWGYSMPEWRDEILRRLAEAGLDPATEAEVAEELAQHLEDRYVELRSRGLEAEHARRVALGELDAHADESGSAAFAVRRRVPLPSEPPGADRGAGWLRGIAGDVRYALRTLRRSPGYTAVVVLTLSLGIGAASSAQAVIDPLLLRPLGFLQPERLVTLDTGLLPGEFDLIRQHTTSFAQLSLVLPGSAFGVSGDGEPERVSGANVTPGFFTMLGVRPILGTLPDAAGAELDETAILAWDFWQQRFGGDAGVIGRPLRIDGRPVVVTAVMPGGFSYPSRTRLWVAAPLNTADPGALWGMGGSRLVGRLRDGATTMQAAAEIRALSPELSAANPFWTPFADYRAEVEVVSLHEALVGDVRRALVLLGAAVGLLLLIACSNVANLVLARGLGRARELAVRTALGASGGRVVRQLLTETLVLAAAGGIAGIALALVAVRALRSVLPPDLPRLAEIGVDLRVLAASIAVTFAVGLLLGVLPARRATRFDLTGSLRDGGRSLGDRSGRRLSGGLVVAQVMLAVLLVTGAGLVARSLIALQRTETGIARMEVVTARVDLPRAQYGAVATRNAFYDELLTRLAAVPGVHAVAATSQLPFGGHLQLTAMLVEHVTPDPNDLPVFVHRRVTPQVFDALGIPLRSGRLLTEADALPDALAVAVVDETAAREFWPGEDPIGRRLGRPWMNEQLVVVGVVGAVLDGELAGAAERTVYTPLGREPPHSAFLVVHGAAGMGVVPTLRSALREIDPTVPLSDVSTVESLVSGTLSAQRLSALLLTSFGVVALLLAVIGIYGVLSYTVTQRARELSLRLALGAGRPQVLGMVLRDGMKLAGTGAVLGIAAALALMRLLHGMLYGVEPHDPATLAGVTLVVLAAAAAAVLVPAVRASRCEPMHVLRE
jgi:putative ABC transport system permease protein